MITCPKFPSSARRGLLLALLAVFAMGPPLIACSPRAPSFHSSDITGASFAHGFSLMDHTGHLRSLDR